MNKNTYTLVGRFTCCKEMIVSVIIERRAACAMTELEYNKMIEAEQRCGKKSKRKVA